MMRAMSVVLAFLLAGCATTAGSDWTRFADGSLNEWLDQEVVPALTRTLSQHPRFKDETIRVAAIDGQQVAGSSNGLTTGVRDRLHSALLQKAGMKIALANGPQRCTAIPVDGYYLAVEATPSGARGANVRLRLFDVVEQQWVSGFVHEWRGDLSTAQRRALGRSVVAASARGSRVLPFDADQSDLLAMQLAADLACQLERSGDDELAVNPARHQGAALIAGNLAERHKITVAAEGELKLETRVHKVDEQLYQVWAILTPVDGIDELSSIATSVYATRPLLKPATPVARREAAPAIIPAPAARTGVSLLSPLQVIGLTGACRNSRWHDRATNLGDRPVIAPASCFGLEFERDPDAQVYVLSHQVDASLRRLYPSRCMRAAVGAGEAAIRFPRRQPPLPWDTRSGTETLYVIAARGARAMDRIDSLVARLPDACSQNNAAQRADPQWLEDIDDAVSDLDGSVAWQAVRVYHQPRHSPRLGQFGGTGR